jgi:hypothetical protein
VYAAIERVFVWVHKTLESSRQKDHPQAYKLGMISEGVELDPKDISKNQTQLQEATTSTFMGTNFFESVQRLSLQVKTSICSEGICQFWPMHHCICIHLKTSNAIAIECTIDCLTDSSIMATPQQR